METRVWSFGPPGRKSRKPSLAGKVGESLQLEADLAIPSTTLSC